MSDTTDGAQTSEDVSVEAVAVDYYMAPPLPADALRGLPDSPCYLLARQVPVMRVFGATPAGQKACVHIHGLFPYFYFRADGDPVFEDADQLKLLLPRIAMEIEAAGASKQQQQAQQLPQQQRKKGNNNKLVAKLLIVQGLPFYGYHERTQLFVQIFLYNPRTTASVVQLLESGTITGRIFQPFEAHIPFLLHVFADYNIEGMNYVHLSNIMFRAPLPTTQPHLKRGEVDIGCMAAPDIPKVFLRGNVPSSMVNGDVTAIAQIVKDRSVVIPRVRTPRWFDRQSSCALELDVAAQCILNPGLFRELQASLRHTGELRNVPSLAAIWEEERQRRLDRGEDSNSEVSATVERQSYSTPSPPSSASSLLSQSFFRQQMQTSVTTIIDQIKSEWVSSSAGAQSASGYDDAPNEARETPVTEPRGVPQSPSKSGRIAMCQNSIMTQSEFSFSQLDQEEQSRDSVREADQSLWRHEEEEDNAVMDLLLSMRRAELLQHDQGNTDGYGDGAYDTASLSEDEGYADGDAGEQNTHLSEIGDILASQIPQNNEEGKEEADQETVSVIADHENVHSGTDNVNDNDYSQRAKGVAAWWEIGEEEERHSCSSSVSEVGSSRFDLKRQSRRIGGDGRPQVDSVHTVDMENVSPPSQIIHSQPLNPINEPLAFPFDPLLLSLSSQSSPATRRSSRDPVNGRNITSAYTGSIWMADVPAPSISELLESSRSLGVGSVKPHEAYFSAAHDIPDKPLIFGGQRFVFSPVDCAHTARFDTLPLRRLLDPRGDHRSRTSLASLKADQHTTLDQSHGKVRRVRIPARIPPGSEEVLTWVHEQHKLDDAQAKKARWEPPTASLSSQNLQSRASSKANLTILSIEIHANSRSDLLPDPLHDRIEFLCFSVEAQEGPTEHKTKSRGIIIVEKSLSSQTPAEVNGLDAANHQLPYDKLGFCIDGSEVSVEVAKDERDLIGTFEKVVRRWDPDFLTGFEVQKESIGFLVDRASQLNVNLIQSLSRLPNTMVDARNTGISHGRSADDDSGNISIGTSWGVAKASGMWIYGRHVLNLWRLARSEVKLSRYAREDVVRAVLKRDFPIYSAAQLTAWYQHGGQLQWKVIRYTLQKATLNLRVLSRMQMITRTSEMARLFGMDFYSVLSRGSQYRVEAVMLRVTKKRNYLLASPSRAQVAGQAPMECIPLVMEPHSSFYSDPVVVLDFQSLYPSLVIGYNLCYSTLYGRLKDGLHAELERKMGVMDLEPPTSIASSLIRDRGNLVIAPNGTLFSSKSQRLGILPVILEEILSTRIMVKKTMKAAKHKQQTRLAKVLDARQLALKMLSNVTYGYTAAGFSGRMPCAQLADAIVQSGRSTLENALRLVEGNEDWNAKVVYGDTDSLFVLLRGRSKDEAFRIGQEIVDAVTSSNPTPVTLKLEKVYMGSILVSKKRYVGFKFEHPTQKKGEIEAKGIELVRRDSCGVVQHAMKRCLHQLFMTSDLTRVKEKLTQYWSSMLEGRVPLHDYLFAKEVRLGTYARGSAPPAALVSAKAMSRDPRAEPRYAERVAYVVVNGAPGARLMDLVMSPNEFIASHQRGASNQYSINNQYYIHKQIIPSLERLFLLMGVNVRSWYAQLPRPTAKARTNTGWGRASSSSRGLFAETRSIDSYYLSKHCRLCGAIGRSMLCDDCIAHPQRSHFALQVLATRRQREIAACHATCNTCSDRDAAMVCVNLTCAVWNHLRLLKAAEAEAASFEL